MRSVIVIGALVLIMLVVLAGFAVPADSAYRPTPTPDSEHYYWLPLMMVAIPTPTMRPTPPAPP